MVTPMATPPGSPMAKEAAEDLLVSARIRLLAMRRSISREHPASTGPTVRSFSKSTSSLANAVERNWLRSTFTPGIWIALVTMVSRASSLVGLVVFMVRSSIMIFWGHAATHTIRSLANFAHRYPIATPQ